MIRFLDDREISSLKSIYNKIISLKILSLDNNVTRFYNGELTFDLAVKTYMHIINGHYFKHNHLLDHANEVMFNYINKYDSKLGEFLTASKSFCNYYDEDSEYYDDMFEIFESMCESMINVISSYLYGFSSMFVTTIYELLYDFHKDEVFSDEKRKMLFRIRKEMLEYAGGYCNARYWYPESMANATIEEKLPDEDDLHDLFQCECFVIAIKIDESLLSEDMYLTRTFNRSIGHKGEGCGIASEIFFEDNNNLFLTITSELTMNIDFSTCIMLAILLYKTKKRWMLLGKNNCRVS